MNIEELDEFKPQLINLEANALKLVDKAIIQSVRLKDIKDDAIKNCPKNFVYQNDIEGILKNDVSK